MRQGFFEPKAFDKLFSNTPESCNRLRMEQRAGLSYQTDLENVKSEEIQKVIDAIIAGVPGAELKDRMTTLQSRKK